MYVPVLICMLVKSFYKHLIEGSIYLNLKKTKTSTKSIKFTLFFSLGLAYRLQSKHVLIICLSHNSNDKSTAICLVIGLFHYTDPIQSVFSQCVLRINPMKPACGVGWSVVHLVTAAWFICHLLFLIKNNLHFGRVYFKKVTL